MAATTIPQVARTSGGQLPSVPPSMHFRIFLRVWPTAGGLKAAQYGFLREMKLSLDKVVSPVVATTVSFGVVGTLFQSMIYNMLISDMYQICTGQRLGSRGAVHRYVASLAPGIAWCVSRETLGMGGGLYLGPVIKARVSALLDRQGFRAQEHALCFASGFMSGACTALCTQWMHNTALLAGRLAAAQEAREAPHYTCSSLRLAYKEMGLGLFTVNFRSRLVLIASAVAILNTVDIFHRSDVRLV
uniref:Mitochondrial carrier protein n=1 Tax=Noctiluca scintillans TaxID=2966 RepID=A0A7S1EX16_NOCSC